MVNEIKKILIISANPFGTDRLRIAAEIRDIKECLERSSNKNKYDIEICEAARKEDVRRKMLAYKPNIVHFCGHSWRGGELVLEDTQGNPEIADVEALTDFFGIFKEDLECVVLNACYSVRQAEEIVRKISYVIGMEGEVEDEFSRKFAVAFYDAVFEGKPYQDAYKIAYSAVYEYPELIKPVLKEEAVCGEYREAVHWMNKSEIPKGICILKDGVGRHEWGAREMVGSYLILAMVYREGIVVKEDNQKSLNYLNEAKKVLCEEPEKWADFGNSLFDIDSVSGASVETAAYLTGAINSKCGNGGSLCILAYKTFYKLNCRELAKKYLRYGAAIYQDKRCKDVLQIMKDRKIF